MSTGGQPPTPGRPRRPRPTPAENHGGAIDPFDLADEPTTFRPAPIPPPSADAPRPKPKPKPRATPERPGVTTGGDFGMTGNSAKAKAKGNPNPSAGGKSKPTPTGGPIVFGPVTSGNLASFCRQFGVYLDSGVDLLKALTNLQNQFSATALGPILDRVLLAVRRGDSLSDAMAREPKAFDILFLSMLRVAEARGGLPETLRRMGEHYEARQRMMRQARSALIYPAAVILVATAVGGLLTIVVLPKLVGILEDMTRGKAITMPLPTRMLMAFSHFIQAFGWWALPAALIGTVVGLRVAYKTPKGKSILDEVALRVPVMGLLLRKIDIARMARTLSDLLDAGVDYGAAMDLTADVLHLTPFRKVIREARTEVIQGVELSTALAESRRFPSDVIAIVGTGEETGKLPESLDRLADDYEEQVQTMVKNLGHLIQPLIVMVLGGIVFFIALAFVMAYVSMISSLSAGF